MTGVSDNISVTSKATQSTGLTQVTASSLSSAPSDDLRSSGTFRASEARYRAVHRISLSSLTHNYACVESAANRQRCSVIVVVKADGYGHGAINTALHLADSCGAEAFAVATLEEAISLRRAFETTPPFGYRRRGNGAIVIADDVSTLFTPPDSVSAESPSHESNRSLRPAKIRILVLGPPVGYPRCFDDYHHYDIEAMVSGPEIASALMDWVSNPNERKRTQVARAAMEAKANAFNMAGPKETVIARPPVAPKVNGNANGLADINGHDATKRPSVVRNSAKASTLSNMSGQSLASELRSIVKNQQAVEAIRNSRPPSPANTESSFQNGKDSVVQRVAPSMPPPENSHNGKGELFEGIEAVVMSSRHREIAEARVNAIAAGELVKQDIEEPLSNGTATKATTPVGRRRRLRWHALVDSGMGRLGFKTEANGLNGKQRRDTVDILKELVHAQIHCGAPIEFYGMCTHMAEANSSSDYTNAQMSRFLELLARVRNAGIMIPTLSTDNSSALLTTSLNHFNPSVVLKQAHVDTRGWVRTGGAIYGQRSDFPQLRAVSTLMASVRHVAVLKKGDSAGYERAYVAPVDVRIATLTIGFADGYPRELGNGVGKVSIRGTVFPIAGNVCMDMMMVELGPASDEDSVGSQVVVGDNAYLWGPEREDDEDGGLVELKELASTLKTTQSALTCGLDKSRVRRELF